MLDHAKYHPAWWLPGPNLQTLWAARVSRPPVVTYRPERLELPDGDFVDLAWAGDPGAPLIVVLHGLEGSAESPYVRRLVQALITRGYGTCVMHFRGCSGTPNRLARSYHSGDTGDLKFLLDTLQARLPNRALGAVGYSLGGNVVLKFLGELGSRTSLVAAAAVSVPFDLAAAASRLNQGFSRIYQRHLVSSMRTKLKRKFSDVAAPIDLTHLHRWRTFWEYDEHVTAPLHGFASAADYYAQSSSRNFIKRITIPTLVVHALDDPFLPASAVPLEHEIVASITFELVARGGHVGFVMPHLKAVTNSWLERRLLAHFEETIPLSHATSARMHANPI
ncbi:MAG: hydrolase [Gammaproteobacteria bacterium]|nr:hydrolase [Gammaproteobacteria bacterium]